ncbi:MAG: 3TM-type holin, partial [Alphaproteobacteria bacterium]
MVVSTIVGQLAGPLFGLIDKLFTSEDERAAAKQKLLELEQAGELEATRQQLSVILAEAQSADPWTSRARPTFLYLMYVIIMMCVGGAIAGIWWPDSVTTAAQNMTNLLGAIPERLALRRRLSWLYGCAQLRQVARWRS